MPKVPIAPYLEEITGTVAVRAIGTFGIDTSQLHWDMTSFSLYGACDHPDEVAIQQASAA
jgi:hypothetical protein